MYTIIHVISTLSRGGKERQLFTLLKYNHAFNFKVVYFYKSNNSYLDDYNLDNIEFKRLTANSKLKRFLQLYHYLKLNKPNLVMTWGNQESMLILPISYLLKLKFVNGSIRHGIVNNKKISHKLRSSILKISPNIIANSNAGIKANHLKKGTVIYNGIDTDFLKIKQNLSKELKELSLTKPFPVIVSVANFLPYKDYFTVLDVLKKLNDLSISFYYLIIGDGPLKHQINSIISSYNLKDYIRILGSKSNVIDYLRISDIFLHSSKGEGCSNSILEAMISGLPIIATDTGGTPEIVKKEFSFLFNYKNKDQLFKALKTLLLDKDLITSMGKKARIYAEKNFNVEKMISNYNHEFNRIITQNENY